MSGCLELLQVFLEMPKIVGASHQQAKKVDWEHSG